MSHSTEELIEQASNPDTPLTDLQHLAQNYPSLRHLIAANPSTYPALLHWLEQFDTPQIKAALAARTDYQSKTKPPAESTAESKLAQEDSRDSSHSFDSEPQTASFTPVTPTDYPLESADSKPEPDLTFDEVAGRAGDNISSDNATDSNAEVDDFDTDLDFYPVLKTDLSTEVADSGPDSFLIRKSVTEKNKQIDPAAFRHRLGKVNSDAASTASITGASDESHNAWQSRLAAEADLRNYAASTQPAPGRKKLWFSLAIVLVLALLLSLGGNLVDYLTGGSGKHSWYGANGVISRVFGSTDLSADRNNNGIPDDEEESNNQSNDASASDQSDESGNQNLALELNEESREVVTAPTTQVAVAKSVPDGAFQITDFLVDNGNIHCTIGSILQCDVINYQGNIGQQAGNGVRFTLNSSGAGGPIDLGVTTLSGNYALLAAGASAATGNYACTSSGNGVDCWHLQTGVGILLTSSSAQAYSPEITTNSTNTTQ